MGPRRPTARSPRFATRVLGAVALAGTALAHGGSLGAVERDSVTVPTWVFVSTVGAAVGASVLLRVS